jgi:hypothetical protein
MISTPLSRAHFRARLEVSACHERNRGRHLLDWPTRRGGVAWGRPDSAAPTESPTEIAAVLRSNYRALAADPAARLLELALELVRVDPEFRQRPLMYLSAISVLTPL